MKSRGILTDASENGISGTKVVATFDIQEALEGKY